MPLQAPDLVVSLQSVSTDQKSVENRRLQYYPKSPRYQGFPVFVTVLERTQSFDKPEYYRISDRQ